MADNKDEGGIYELWKQNVPASARMYLQTLFGDRSKPFTEKDFTKSELAEMEAAINASKTRLQEKSEANLNHNMAYLQHINTLSTGADKLIPLIKKDKEWKEFGKLTKQYGSYPDMPEEARSNYSKLFNTLIERYGNLAPGKFIWSIMGQTDPNAIKDAYKQRLDYFSGNGQQEEVIKDLQKAALNKQQIARGEGNVQYNDYTESMPENRLAAMKNSELQGNYSDAPTIAKSLGRFTYETTPEGKRVIKDNYDFYNDVRAPIVDAYEKMGPVEKTARVAQDVGLGALSLDPYSIASTIGNAYIGKDGRPVQVSYDPKEITSPNVASKRKGGTAKVVNSMAKPISGGKKTI